MFQDCMERFQLTKRSEQTRAGYKPPLFLSCILFPHFDNTPLNHYHPDLRIRYQHSNA
jgi:hypothetical protein